MAQNPTLKQIITAANKLDNQKKYKVASQIDKYLTKVAQSNLPDGTWDGDPRAPWNQESPDTPDGWDVAYLAPMFEYAMVIIALRDDIMQKNQCDPRTAIEKVYDLALDKEHFDELVKTLVDIYGNPGHKMGEDFAEYDLNELLYKHAEITPELIKKAAAKSFYKNEDEAYEAYVDRLGNEEPDYDDYDY